MLHMLKFQLFDYRQFSHIQLAFPVDKSSFELLTFRAKLLWEIVIRYNSNGEQQALCSILSLQKQILKSCYLIICFLAQLSTHHTTMMYGIECLCVYAVKLTLIIVPLDEQKSTQILVRHANNTCTPRCRFSIAANNVRTVRLFALLQFDCIFQKDHFHKLHDSLPHPYRYVPCTLKELRLGAFRIIPIRQFQVQTTIQKVFPIQMGCWISMWFDQDLKEKKEKVHRHTLRVHSIPQPHTV